MSQDKERGSWISHCSPFLAVVTRQRKKMRAATWLLPFPINRFGPRTHKAASSPFIPLYVLENAPLLAASF
jgi:hypothetical protein